MFEKSRKKIKLHGFNNLTKSLSFNIYDISYTPSTESRREYLEYIDEEYNAGRLKNILEHLVDSIGAKIISTSTQDYDPMGASATILISEGDFNQVMHLDKSHCSAHTYPESNDKLGVSTFRVDIDVSTCGKVSPLKALDYLINSFDSDIVIIDYKVRGFTRDIHGVKHYMDHNINSIQDFISKRLCNKYTSFDVNNYQENIYHTKMILKKFVLDNYLFKKEEKLNKKARSQATSILRKEMEEIFNAKNFST